MNFNLKKVEKHTHPFPYAIIENPFEEAENIERDFPSMDNGSHPSGWTRT
tara:strand:- start:1456 stop:1605 length:150 start_codon:yes stop_codon:yes gene_type:complete